MSIFAQIYFPPFTSDENHYSLSTKIFIKFDRIHETHKKNLLIRQNPFNMASKYQHQYFIREYKEAKQKKKRGPRGMVDHFRKYIRPKMIPLFIEFPIHIYSMPLLEKREERGRSSTMETDRGILVLHEKLDCI